MSTITLRATKGSPLTNTEVDNNFSNLNTDKLESTYAGAMNSLTGGSSIVTLSSTTGVTTGVWKATTIGTTYGGTGLTSYATGDILYASASNTLSKLAKPSAASYLKMDSAGTPTWDTLGLDDITATGTVTTGTWNASVIAPAYGGTGVANNAANTLTFTGNYSLGLTLSANTSVTLPTTGTLATLAGAESLTNKKLGSLTSNGLVTTSGGDGTLSVTTTLGVATGGTGATSFTAGQILYGNGTSALSSTSGLFFDTTNVAVGIGTNTPWSSYTGKIAVIGTVNSAQTIYMRNDNAGSSSASGIALNAYGNTWGIEVGSTANNSNSLTFKVDYLGTNQEKMRINTSGALGFGGANYGTSGQVLTSAGSSAVPTWQTNNAATTGKAIAMAMVFGG
jgi:hypothetical protein